MAHTKRRLAAWPTTVGLTAALAVGGLVAGTSAASAADTSPGAGTQVSRPDPSTVPFFGWRLRILRDHAIVVAVTADGPAATAGIEARDQVISIHGVAIDHRGSLREAMDGVEPGDTVAVVISRDGSEQSLRVQLESQAERPGPEEHPYLGAIPERPISADAGGVTIASVNDGSPAADAGVEPGDVITEINGASVAGLRALGTALKDLSPGDTVSLTVVRDGFTFTIKAELGSQADNPNPLRDRVEAAHSRGLGKGRRRAWGFLPDGGAGRTDPRGGRHPGPRRRLLALAELARWGPGATPRDLVSARGKRRSRRRAPCAGVRAWPRTPPTRRLDRMRTTIPHPANNLRCDGSTGETSAALSAMHHSPSPSASIHPTGPAYLPRSRPSSDSMSAAARSVGVPHTAADGWSASTSPRLVVSSLSTPVTSDDRCMTFGR